MDIQSMMKQAQQMQERLKKQMESIRIDPEVVTKDDVEMLQDLIVAAMNDAARKVDEQLGHSMSGLMGGMNIPGLS